jgi:hypothetical protein
MITELEIFAKESNLSNQILLKRSQSTVKFNFLRRNSTMHETMKNEADKCRFFLENQSLRQTGIILAGSDCWDLILLQKSLTLLL